MSKMKMLIREISYVFMFCLSIVFLFFSSSFIGHKVYKNLDFKGRIDTAYIKSHFQEQMVYVEVGLGDSLDSSKRPSKNYYMSKFELTDEECYMLFGGKSMFSKISESIDFAKDGPNFARGSISPYFARDVAKQLKSITGENYTLPTIEQWKFAASGGLKSKNYKYIGGDSAELVAWFSANSKYNLHPVGSLVPNELGLYDMAGNVSEWCVYKPSTKVFRKEYSYEDCPGYFRKPGYIIMGSNIYSKNFECTSDFIAGEFESDRIYQYGLRVVREE